MIPMLKMNDGKMIPQLGLGVWQASDAEVLGAIKTAAQAGYRQIDTARRYDNEAGVGEAIRACGVERDEMFVTTKVWNNDQGYEATLRAFDASLERLKMDVVDLFLIHWPVPEQGLATETWKALIALQKQGRARSIGVCNFRESDLDELIDATGVTPAINQIEIHPAFQQADLIAANTKRGILSQAWSPLGQGKMLQDPTIANIAAQHQRTPAQIILRWHIEQGHVVIPKSVTPSRILENAAVFDFALTDSDLTAIKGLDRTDGRIGPDPATFAMM
ncbi:aldo/keto reductase [Albirhodobacter sp. R86504]|jgi:2,5-diketo-D-gluconate reductase A|uniref:aldo/keto reductase n=1 Tax=Albirhodobacter sp. R86504 TaxID=3093848 RepID=UPI00366D47FA